MEKKTKDITTYIVINLILLIIAALLTFYIIVEYNANKESIVTSVSEQTNVIVSSIEAEKDSNKDSTNNTDTILPIIIDSNNSTSTSDIKYYKYYYNQLDTNAKDIYSEIEENIENMKTGTYTIKLSSELANNIDYNDISSLTRDFQSAWDAIMMDRVDLFYIDVSKISLKVKTTTYITSVTHSLYMSSNSDSGYLETGFTNEQSVSMALAQVNNVSDQIVNNLSGTDYNKIYQAHDWLVNNLNYDSSNGNNVYNIYGAFIDNKAVCEGYAESFKYIMDKVGIPCVLISGTAQNSEGTTESHEWNYVELDGKWYAVDSTWDDPILQGGATLTKTLMHKYLLKGSNLMDKNHYPSGKFSTNGMTFTYPNLEAENY